MRTYTAILFLALLAASTCFSVPALPAKRRLGMGMSPAQKTTFLNVLKAGLSLLKKCAIDELNKYLPSVLKGMGISPDGIVEAIIKFTVHAVEAMVGGKRRRRSTVLGSIKGAVVAVGGTIAQGARGAAHGIGAVGSSMKSIASKLNKMTGGLVEKALSELGCPALMVAIKAGVLAAFPGIILPGCVSSWFTEKCKSTVASAFKRARLLRRLTAIRREIQKF